MIQAQCLDSVARLLVQGPVLVVTETFQGQGSTRLPAVCHLNIPDGIGKTFEADYSISKCF